MSQGRCENCGKVCYKLEWHHSIWRANRKKFFERVFTTIMFCNNCHQFSGKFEALPKFKKEVETILLKDFDMLEVICMMGSSGLEL